MREESVGQSQLSRVSCTVLQTDSPHVSRAAQVVQVRHQGKVVDHQTDLLDLLASPGHGGLCRSVGSVIAGAEGVVEVNGLTGTARL